MIYPAEMEVNVEEAQQDKAVTRGFSLPLSLHLRIDRYARATGLSKSMVVNQALRMYMKVHPIPHDDREEEAS